MKTFNYIISFIIGALIFTSCDSDRDSNPTFQTPTEFVLNTPRYVNGVYDLKEDSTILLTCSQPNYGFAASVKYAVEVSVSSSFADSVSTTLATTYTTARMDVSTTEIAKAIVPLMGITKEEDFPTTAFPLYFRLKATVPGAPSGDTILSNIIELPQVKSYFALPPMTLPTEFYAIGTFCNWDWTQAVTMTPVNGNAGKFWAMLWCGKDQGMKFNTATAWDNNQFGVGKNVTISGVDYTDDGGNIKFSDSGWHLVVITATINGRSYDYDVKFLDPNVYVIGVANGGTWGANDSWKFTPPTTSDGEFVSPALAADCAGDDNSNLRLAVVLDGIDWWRTEFIFLDGKIAYRGSGGDQTRIGCKAGQKVYLNFLAGTGRVQ